MRRFWLTIILVSILLIALFSVVIAISTLIFERDVKRAVSPKPEQVSKVQTYSNIDQEIQKECERQLRDTEHQCYFVTFEEGDALILRDTDSKSNEIVKWVVNDFSKLKGRIFYYSNVADPSFLSLIFVKDIHFSWLTEAEHRLTPIGVQSWHYDSPEFVSNRQMFIDIADGKLVDRRISETDGRIFNEQLKKVLRNDKTYFSSYPEFAPENDPFPYEVSLGFPSFVRDCGENFTEGSIDTTPNAEDLRLVKDYVEQFNQNFTDYSNDYRQFSIEEMSVYVYALEFIFWGDTEKIWLDDSGEAIRLDGLCYVGAMTTLQSNEKFVGVIDSSSRNFMKSHLDMDLVNARLQMQIDQHDPARKLSDFYIYDPGFSPDLMLGDDYVEGIQRKTYSFYYSEIVPID